jgi:hypothetical protein
MPGTLRKFLPGAQKSVEIRMRPEAEPMSGNAVQLITCSYSGDFEVCRLLCASVDKFAPEGMSHRLYVPRHDLPLFAELATSRRTLGAQEDLLPKWLWKVPLPGPKWRARLRLPRRNVYLTPFSLPVRGWIAQQMMKIAATLRSEVDIVVHVDSDSVFIRPFTVSNLVTDGKTRFHASDVELVHEAHKPWYAAAARLLGLPESDYYTAEYIDQIVVWRRTVVQAMTARIEATTGMNWAKSLAKTPHFAEYVLYGVFVEQVLGLDAAGLSKHTRSLSHSRWTGDFTGPEDETAFVESLPPDQIACAIQSTNSAGIEERKRILERVTERAAEQDSQR